MRYKYIIEENSKINTPILKFDKFNFLVVVCKNIGSKSDPIFEVYCWIEKFHKPTRTYLKRIRKILDTDPEYGLVGKMDDMMIRVITGNELVEFKKEFF
jgi:hypothetical protein